MQIFQQKVPVTDGDGHLLRPPPLICPRFMGLPAYLESQIPSSVNHWGESGRALNETVPVLREQVMYHARALTLNCVLSFATPAATRTNFMMFLRNHILQGPFVKLPGRLSPDAILFHEWSNCSNIFWQDMHHSKLYEYTSWVDGKPIRTGLSLSNL
jgi:hypothetical protein